MISVGVDAGSRTIKVVILDGRKGRVIASGVTDQGVRQAELAGRLYARVLKEARLRRGDVTAVVATGYGRDAIEFADTTVTEITCHARGVFNVARDARTVVDIGGQDSKVLRLQADGSVRDFAVNDRCAAGTGRFLEVVAARLGAGLDDLGEMARKARKPSCISSTCVVFAETEIIGLLAAGEKPENIVAGVQSAMAARIAAMAGGRATPPVIFTGGVALVSGMAPALKKALGHAVRVARDPQLTGALGAALIAADIR